MAYPPTARIVHPPEEAETTWGERLLTGQLRILDAMGRGAAMGDVLALLCAWGEGALPGAACAVLLVDETCQSLRVAAVGSAAGAAHALDALPIGPAGGACGAAAQGKLPVTIDDLAHDPRAGALRAPLLQQGFRSWSSTPLLGPDGVLLGTWAMFRREAMLAPARAALVASAAAALAGVAIGQEQARGRAVVQQAALDAGRYAAARAAEEERARLQAMLHEAPAAVCVLRGPEHRVELINAPYRALIGNRDIIGRTVRGALPELEGQGFFELLDGVYRTGVAHVGREMPAMIDRTGTGRVERAYFNFVYAPWHEADGSVAGIFASAVDVTDLVMARREAEELLKDRVQMHDWLRDALNLAPMPVLFIEPGTARVTFSNRAADAMAGGDFPKGTAAEAYHTVYYCTYPDGRRIPDEEMPGVRVARGETLRGFEMDWHTPGGMRSLLIDADTLPAMHGQPATCVLVFQDISRLKGVERELAVANERLRALDQVKTQFLNMASHELRTPLTPMLLRLDMISADERLLPDQRRAVTVVHRNAHRLGALISDILDVARLESGRFPMRKAPMDLSRAARDAVETFDVLAREKGVTLVAELPAPVVVDADPARVAQVVSNLVENAMKYTPRGGRVTVSTQARSGRGVLHVADTGPGLTPDQTGLLFQPFSQVHDVTPGADGSGLGLYISRRIVEEHGGRIGVESPGRGLGSVFFVELPAAPPAGSPAARDAPSQPGTPGAPR